MSGYNGVVLDLDERLYHADSALSSTGARELLKAPRVFQWNRTHPKPHKKVFDVGTAAHKKVLGAGAQTVVIPKKLLATNGAVSTSAAKAFVAEAREAGKTAVVQAVMDQVNAISESILAQPEARALLEQAGDPEVSVFSTDPETGVELRARFDFLPNFMQADPVAVDLKTAGGDADAEAFAKTVATLGYDVQDAHYLDTHTFASGDPSMRMKFIVVEKEPPYLVAVHELSLEFTEIGRARARKARHLFKAWSDSQAETWGGYDLDQIPLQPPLWHIYQNQGLLQ